MKLNVQNTLNVGEVAYIVTNEREGGMDVFAEFYTDIDEANGVAANAWNGLTKSEKASRHIWVGKIVGDGSCLEDCSEIWGVPFAFDSKNADKFFTSCREAGYLIDMFYTYAEAKAEIEAYEAQDKEEGTFEPNFYEVVNFMRETVDENSETI